MLPLHITVVLMAIFSIEDVMGCGGGRKEAERMAREHERRMQITLMELCSHICVTDWSQWTKCTKPCGGGERKRSRKNQTIGKCRNLKNFQCGKRLAEKEACNEGCVNGGTPSGTACSCTPAWSGKCCTTRVTCPYPRRPDNGYVYGKWPANYDSVATYQCHEGYHLQGDEISKCGAGGKWLQKTPTCGGVACPKVSPIPPMNILNPDSNSFGDQVFYDCPHGYVHKGPVFRTCIKNQGTTGKWDGFEPTCQPVDCGAPIAPRHGTMNGTSFRYGDEVTFACNSGFQLVGSHILKCIATGRWLGNVPECTVISCDSPEEPKHGSVRLGKGSVFDAKVTYECEDGYLLEGNKALKCLASGEWNGTAPTCKAAICGNPGKPDHGSKDGSVYYYPHKVDYACHLGYVLTGAKEITCEKSGKWSSPKPSCTACREGTYMDNLEKPGVCQRCPPHTSTLTKASTNLRQCLCDKGYDGPSGGPCREIICDELFAPQPHGLMAQCDHKIGSQCQFGCIDGYIIDKGSSIRTCLESGEWDGRQPHCSACPKDTFKTTNRTCLPCPQNSATEKAGSKKVECKCVAGYSGPGGGPCQDVNECLENNGKGSCEDTCENRDGTFACQCTRPGYELNDDKRTCFAKQECQNLTRDDAPDNGGLVCHWYNQESSQQCSVMCNDGYEFPARTNDYETCGPSTGFEWSYKNKDPKAFIAPCIVEYFPGLRIETDAAYFTTACDELTEDDKVLVYQNFKERLDNASVCMTSRGKVCNIEDMGIICGKRTKRDIGDGTTQTVDEVDLLFNVKSLKMGETPKHDCKNICRQFRIPKDRCTLSLCTSSYKRYLKAAVLYAKKQLTRLFRNQVERSKFKFDAAGRKFLPKNQKIIMGGVEVECPIGMVANEDKDTCIPCDAGTFWNSTSTDCDPCPVGTYQPFKNTTTCVKCHPGSYSTKSGTIVCTRCPPGMYGEQCSQNCTCVQGTCNPIDGKCTCMPGWEGENCDVDVDGCVDVSCYPSVACIDAPAPATGSSCGPCPPGLVGDGFICQRTEL